MTELPDVNVLVALLWEAHLHQRLAREWFRRRGADALATCSVTQAGFVRASSNPRVLPDAISVADARAVLAILTDRSEHVFLPDAHGFIGNPFIEHQRVVGYRQVTDAVILAVARQHGARVITFDAGLAQLGGRDVHRIGA